MFFTLKTNLQQDVFDRSAVLFSKAEIPLYQPWFLCEVPEFENDEILSYTTYVLADLDSLRAFTETQMPVRAYVLSPGCLNNSETWKLQILKAVSKAQYQHDTGSTTVYRYEVENGVVFDDYSGGISQLAHSLSFQTILQFT